MASVDHNSISCGSARSDRGAPLALRVLPGAPRIRASRTSRWRAMSLILVHLLIIAHIVQWLITGRTLSPVEPSEAMYTLNQGYVNAGAVFFAAALLVTLVFGRFVCGWGCHVVAYQDLCAWLLKKIGVRVRPLRARWLVAAPLLLALYMFVWPTVYRWAVGAPRPSWTNHMVIADFWATFPGPVVAVLTVLVCGFVIVYFLGSKGFCTYACPYGGFFGVTERFAPGRIRVTDACEHCGHCTSACTSNVRVHEEVARFGMVVDPGCMKCMDCVSVCPNDALYFGWGRPGVLAMERPSEATDHRRSKPVRSNPFEFTAAEEALMGVIGIGALLAFRGLYGQIPLLFAMGLAAITAWLVVKFIRVAREPNVRLQNFQLRRGARLGRAGWTFVLVSGVWFAFTAHSAVIQVEAARGTWARNALQLSDDVWLPGTSWSATATSEDVSRLRAAIDHLRRSDRWGLMSNPRVLEDLVWLHLADSDTASAEAALQRLVDLFDQPANAHRGLGAIRRKDGRLAEAEQAYRRCLELEPRHEQARRELTAVLLELGRGEDAVALARENAALWPDEPRWTIDTARLLMRLGRWDDVRTLMESAASKWPDSPPVLSTLGGARLERGDVTGAIAALTRATELDPEHAEARYHLGYALLIDRRPADAVPQLERAIALNSSVAAWHYNLGVALFSSGRPADALPAVREALRLDPGDAQAWGFIAVVHEALGDIDAARDARQRADEILGGAARP